MTKDNTGLKTSDFYYDLPEERIAQTPIEPRDASRLLVLDREDGSIEHKHFYDITDYITDKDVLVINNSKVIPARIYGKRQSDGADIEVLLLRARGLNRWEVLTRPGKHAKIGTKLSLGNGALEAQVVDIVGEGNRLLEFSFDTDKYSSIYSLLHEIGTMPLPPYIKERLKDGSRYQTVYARDEGSAAAPTAGLHFTPELLDKIHSSGTAVAEVMLHVGLGTFRPVKVENVTEHVMHSEYYEITAKTAELINTRRKNGGRIIAVGTTSCRVLESASKPDGTLEARTGDTDIFIYPGYKFKAVDDLITNFHLPESTLMMLVSAFTNRENIMNAYSVAVKEKYRFFSFGDAMLIHGNKYD